jgi:hypothetical protein
VGTGKLIVPLLAALLCGCGGPRVTVTEVALHPGARAGVYEVEARLVNAGGRGDVRVTVRLRNRSSGEVVSQTRVVAFERGDRQVLAVPVAVPPADYTPDVIVDYPP